MSREPPPPLCHLFVVCRQIAEDANLKDIVLVGLPQECAVQRFPAGQVLGFFARVTSGHGEYLFEVRLQSSDGTFVWCDGPPEYWPMPEPLHVHDLRLNLCVVFPAAGDYEFVLAANGKPIASQPFKAVLLPQLMKK